LIVLFLRNVSFIQFMTPGREDQQVATHKTAPAVCPFLAPAASLPVDDSLMPCSHSDGLQGRQVGQPLAWLGGGRQEEQHPSNTNAATTEGREAGLWAKLSWLSASGCWQGQPKGEWCCTRTSEQGTVRASPQLGPGCTSMPSP